MTTHSIAEYRAKYAKPKRSKYGSKRTASADGIVHMSAKQAKRWDQLCYMQKMGLIRDLKREVTYNFTVNGMILRGLGGRPLAYRLDHEFFDVTEGRMVYEDVKSDAVEAKEVWPYKRALMFAVHGIEIQVI